MLEPPLPFRQNSPKVTGVLNLYAFYIMRFKEVFEYEQICVFLEKWCLKYFTWISTDRISKILGTGD